MAKRNIRELVEDILGDFLTAEGLELYNSEFQKEGKDWFLRIYIDKLNAAEEEYVSTDDCEKVSRFLSEKLDEQDPIEQNYFLEVSSPGMDRQLFKEEDYKRFSGKIVDVKLYKGIDGKKTFQGTLEGLIDGNVVIIDDDSRRLVFPLAQVAKTSLAIVF